jgi:REP element-mobilizing transposase RayT
MRPPNRLHYGDLARGQDGERAARTVQDTLFENQSHICHLHGWAIIPNHVYVLVKPRSVDLATTVKSLKGASSNKVNRVLGRSGRLWQPGYFDRLIRDSKHFLGVLRFIEWNPLNAKLCADRKRWAWSSACPDARARLDHLNLEREKLESGSTLA